MKNFKEINLGTAIENVILSNQIFVKDGKNAVELKTKNNDSGLLELIAMDREGKTFLIK